MPASAGFAGLSYLKTRLLPEARRGDTDHDVELTRLGMAVMGRFDRHCNRTLAYGTAVTTASAGGTVFCARNYPVDAFGLTVAGRDVGGLLASADAAAGLFYFSAAPGAADETLVIKADGGYACNEDPQEPDQTTNAIPDEIVEAWLIEVQREIERRGLFGAVALRAGDKDKPADPSGLGADTLETLRPYRRLAY